MYKLGILSRDWREYERVIVSALPAEIELTFTGEKGTDAPSTQHINILLADPDLLAPCLDKFEKLKWVQSSWAGVTPLISAGRTNYCLTGLKGVFGDKMREYVFAYLLYFSRNINTFKQSQRQKQWLPPSIDSLKRKQLGILGVGDIGAEIAKTAKHFGMQVKGLTRSNRDCAAVDEYFDIRSKQGFCQGLDYVVNLLPDTPQTANIIDADFLSALPPKCVLINAGRGQAIDDEALIKQLKNKRLRAAVLDVFTQEPLPADNPFWELDNVIVTQHTAAISDVQDISQVFLGNLDCFITEKKLTDVVDWEKGY